MAQNNPINESASLNSTASANGPLTTDSSYKTSTSSSHPSTNTTTTTASNPTSKVSQAGEFTKNMLAAAHGAGEKLRGELNSTVDQTFNESEGVAKNERIANAGESELSTGQFSTSTKNREGVIPSDHERTRA